MCCSEQSKDKIILENIKNNIVNDYFTPNVKAEVIFDMLMTDTVADIVGHYVGEDVHFITKEMSLVTSNDNLKGKKVDYVLAGKECIYLVELKTTTGSYNEDQKKFYRGYLDKKFSLMLTTLLDIADSKFGNITIRKNLKQGVNPIENLDFFFNERIKKYKNNSTGIHLEENLNKTEKAKAYLKKNKCESSWKYLLTMGQILDYFDRNQGKYKEWSNIPLKLVYITPNGEGLNDIIDAKKIQAIKDIIDNKDINDSEKIETIKTIEDIKDIIDFKKIETIKDFLDIKQISITFRSIIEEADNIYKPNEKPPVFAFLCEVVKECMDFPE